MASDAELYNRAATGDAASLAALLERHLPQLHAYVRKRLGNLRVRESSMDVVQSVCRGLLADGGGFDFRGEERFRAWLFTAALNKIRDKHRFHHGAGRDLRREEQAAVDEVPGASSPSPSEHAIVGEAARQVHDVLATLSPDHREVITLARLVELPHAVIAEMMDRTEEATRQLLGRALVQFTLALRHRGIEPD
jgi:RNA polymerase sigma-70 factor (ECF subfamily)